MKIVHGLITAGLFAAALYSAPTAAASLLGGLINTGSDSGNSSGLVSSNDNGSIGVGGSNGLSVNLGGLTGGLTDGGGSGGGLGGTLGGLTGGGGSVGVPGVAEISAGQSSGGGSSIGLSLLGGGSTNISTNPGSLLGNGGGLNLSLPGLGGSSGTPGAPGTPGRPGTNGTNGIIGTNGFGGTNGFNGFSGTAGRDGVAIPGNASSRLRSILAMLAQRDWIQLVNGRAICLNGFGTAEVSSWLPQRDMRGLYSAMGQFTGDISTLRQLLANCRSGQQRQALNVRDLNRVIGIDIGSNGVPTLYML